LEKTFGGAGYIYGLDVAMVLWMYTYP
jgi:hypothetical protein